MIVESGFRLRWKCRGVCACRDWHGRFGSRAYDANARRIGWSLVSGRVCCGLLACGGHGFHLGGCGHRQAGTQKYGCKNGAFHVHFHSFAKILQRRLSWGIQLWRRSSRCSASNKHSKGGFSQKNLAEFEMTGITKLRVEFWLRAARPRSVR